MKSIILYISLLLLLTTEHLNAQCIQNGDFDDYCGPGSGGCPTISAGCLSNWIRSHGTPQVFTPGPAAHDNMVYMWGSDPDLLGQAYVGEGIFGSYSFRSGYTHQIRIRLNAEATSTGQIVLYAANNMVESMISFCGNPLPTVSSKELIGTITEVNVGWKEYTINYTPTSSYSQLWIYPFTSVNDTRVDLYVDYIFTCDPCDATIIYNTGQVPSGTTRAENIYAGSSAGTGGSGTVTIDANATTTFVALNEIGLKDLFSATVSSGQFTARIDPSCGSARYQRQNIDVSKFPKDPIDGVKDQLGVKRTPGNKNQPIDIYPNPTKGSVTIQQRGSKGESVLIQVFDSMGKLVLEKKSSMNGGIITVDISTYENGYYFIKITKKDGVYSQKILFQR